MTSPTALARFWATALLVTAGSTARADLVDNGDATVTDTASGLMWLKNADTAGPMTWDAANAWVQGLNAATFAGHSDWRLPSGTSPDGAVCNSQPSGANCTGTEFATLYFARTIMAYAPGPFQNLRAGNYWTATEMPGDPSRAMAQDFVDGGQNPFLKTRGLYGWAVRAAGPLPAGTPQMYGVVSQGSSAGALIRIDTQNGAVSVVGPTGFESACGLAFDAVRGRLLLSPCWGQAPLQVVNRDTGAASPLGPGAGGVTSIAHRPTDDRIYGIEPSPALMSLDAQTGANAAVVGFIDKASVGGVASRPSDGQLFGVGKTAGGVQRLFQLRHGAGVGPRDVDVGGVPGTALRALTFHPDGRLFGTDGEKIVTIDPATGSIASPVQLTGASFGAVGAIAVTGPSVRPRPDFWIKDCKADRGDVPSAPKPCAIWQRSPDIVVGSGGDGIPEPVVVGRANSVWITVRNRGPAADRFAVVRLYSGIRSGAPALVGQRTVEVPAGGSARVTMPWRPTQRPRAGSAICLGVLLEHPRDRAVAGVDPPRDNNKAIHCYTRSDFARP